jgi:hypothetical protein
MTLHIIMPDDGSVREEKYYVAVKNVKLTLYQPWRPIGL